jgi:dTDP-4-dehydrorhamnose 3,5-epimerase-like enzyme
VNAHRVLVEQLEASFGGDVSVIEALIHDDDRGRLSAFDFEGLPFTVRRVFTVTGVPLGTRRGGHLHSRGIQALFCLDGRVEVELRRRGASLEVVLRPDGLGLGIGPGVWSQQRYLDDRSELLVLASEPYDPATYDPEPA